jgi:hypothetical protein
MQIINSFLLPLYGVSKMKAFLLGFIYLGCSSVASADEDRPQGNVTTMIRDEFNVVTEPGVFITTPPNRLPRVNTNYRGGSPVPGCPISTAKPVTTAGAGKLHFEVQYAGTFLFTPLPGEYAPHRTLTRVVVNFIEEVPTAAGTIEKIPRFWEETINLSSFREISMPDGQRYFSSHGYTNLNIDLLNAKKRISNPISDLYVSFCDIAPGSFYVGKVTITDTQDL